MDVMQLRRGLMMGMVKGVYKKIYSGEIQCSTTDGNITNIATITVEGAYTDRKIIYVKIRDKAGKRDGYYYGNDCFSIKGAVGANFVYSHNSLMKIYSTTFGIYIRSVATNDVITISSRYNSQYTSKIDGTYTIEIYVFDWPDNDIPFDD